MKKTDSHYALKMRSHPPFNLQKNNDFYSGSAVVTGLHQVPFSFNKLQHCGFFLPTSTQATLMKHLNFHHAY